MGSQGQLTEAVFQQTFRAMRPNEGNASSGLLFCRQPLDGPLIVIERDVKEGFLSAKRLAPELSWSDWQGLVARLAPLRESALVVDFQRLTERQTLEAIYDHLGLTESFPVRRLQMLRQLRVQRLQAI